MVEILLGRIKGSSIHAVTENDIQALASGYETAVVGDLYLVTDGDMKGDLFLATGTNTATGPNELELQGNLNGKSIHAVTGNEFVDDYAGNFVAGDLYLITADCTHDDAIRYGHIYEAKDNDHYKLAVATVPIKGVDYFTKADINEIVQRVLAEFPSSEGVSY